MMHAGAWTCFLLRKLTDSISVNFSIRQGDPLAMILYILYIEPLLLHLERSLEGIKIGTFHQVTESFCDDENVVTSNLYDLEKTDAAVKKFEAMSGAILSRNSKCKIMGIGRWKTKKDWPLAYIRTESEVKIFGIYFKDSYKAMIKRNWDVRFEKFANVVKSWSGRVMQSLSSKVEVLKIFALSRVYYVASILPITKAMIQKFESIMGKFVWANTDSFLCISLDEIKNFTRNMKKIHII